MGEVSGGAVMTTAGAIGNGTQLEGRYTDLDGRPVQLEKFRGTTQVVIFVQDTCSACSAEAKELAAYAEANGKPKNFQLRHLLVGSVQQDARDWVEYHKISWDAGIVDVELFKRYCPARKVPCLLVFKPGLGLTFHHTGSLTIEKITEAAGEWHQN